MQIGVDSQRAVENRRIFIVAGDEIIRAAVQFMLHDEYEAHEFGSLEEALRKATDGAPDLLILDAQLLAADGFAAVDRSLQAVPAAALLMIGELMIGEPQPGMANAAPNVGFIPLPLRVESVRTAVATALGSTADAALLSAR